MINFRPQAVLFDLDGTLIDTAPTFILVLNELLRKHGKELVSEYRIREKVSHGARALITLGFGLEEGESGFEELRNELLDAYEADIANGTVLFPGMDKVLKELEAQDIPWGIVTNKPIRFALPLLCEIDLDDRCSVLICPDDVDETKPSPEPLNLACFRLNVHEHECVYIGDHERDIASGNAANMTTVSALYGYIDKNDQPDQWQADFEIKKADELISLLGLK